MIGTYREAESNWLPVSAKEWIASAVILLDPVKIAAKVLAMAIPRLAANAKRIALMGEPLPPAKLFPP